MKSFVRRVRSKSPFRRRRDVSELIAEVEDAEAQYLEDLHRKSPSQKSRTGEASEIEIVLGNTSRHRKTSLPRLPPSHNEVKSTVEDETTLPGSLPTSTGSMDDHPAAVAIDRQKRKSFRDRFMSKQNSKTPRPETPPTPPLPPPHDGPQRIFTLGTSSREKTIVEQPPCTSLSQPPAEKRGRSLTRRGRSRSQSRAMDDPPPVPASPTMNTNSNKISLPQVEQYIAGDKKQLHPPSIYMAAAAPAPALNQPVTIECKSQSRVSELTPVQDLTREMSLGHDSINGVRQALQRMELELRNASTGGQRVSRDRIMNALNVMASALHEPEEKKALAKELDAWMDESVPPGMSQALTKDETETEHPEADDEDDDEDEDEESSTLDYDLGTYGETEYTDDDSRSFQFNGFCEGGGPSPANKTQQTDSSFQDFFQRIGKFLTFSDEDKAAVKIVLGDMLWTDVVGKPDCSVTNKKLKSVPTWGNYDNIACATSRVTDELPSFDPYTCSVQDPKTEPAVSDRERSWWRTQQAGLARDKSKTSQQGVSSDNRSKASQKSRSSKSKSVPRKSKSMGSPMKNNRSIQPKVSGSVVMRPRPTRYAMEDSDVDDVAMSSVDGSDLWHQTDRYTIRQKPAQPARQVNYNQSKLSYPSKRVNTSSSDRFEKNFRKTPSTRSSSRRGRSSDSESENWADFSHPAENLRKGRSRSKLIRGPVV